MLLGMYELLTQMYPGWTLTEIRNLSSRERINWLEKGTNRLRR